MMTPNKIEEKAEKLIDRIRELNFQFKNSSIESEADETKNEAIGALEYFMDLVNQDWDERAEEENEESD